MTGRASIQGVFLVSGRGWAIVLDELSEDFMAKVGAYAWLEKDGVQLTGRPVLAVEFTDKRDETGRMVGYVSLILSNRHSDDLRPFTGGTVRLSPGSS